MNRRARHRGERLPALFGFDAGAPTDQQEVVEDNPLRRECKTADGGCGALIAERCSRPARGGHKPIQGYHDARQLKTTQEVPGA